MALPRGDRATLANWPYIEVRSATTGAYVPITQVATLNFESAPPVIQRFNRERSATVTAFVDNGYNVGRLTNAAEAELRKINWPPGMHRSFGGEAESRQDSFGGLGSAVLIATFGILAILVLEFRSFRGTFIAASVIPLGFVGGFVGLWLTVNRFPLRRRSDLWR